MQFTNYCIYIPFKAIVLSPTRITAYAIRWDIAANLNGSLICCSGNALSITQCFEVNRCILHFKCVCASCFKIPTLISKPTVWSNCAVQCIAINQEALFLAAAMGFQHIHRVDGIFGHPLAVHKLHSNDSINHHVSKEITITEGLGVKADRYLFT